MHSGSQVRTFSSTRTSSISAISASACKNLSIDVAKLSYPIRLVRSLCQFSCFELGNVISRQFKVDRFHSTTLQTKFMQGSTDYFSKEKIIILR